MNKAQIRCGLSGSSSAITICLLYESIYVARYRLPVASLRRQAGRLRKFQRNTA